MGTGEPTDAVGHEHHVWDATELIVHWHETRQGLPNDGIAIDASPIAQVVDAILSHAEATR